MTNFASPASQLQDEQQRWQTLFDTQPALTQRFFEAQARPLADAIVQKTVQAKFTLPDKITTTEKTIETLATDSRDYTVGGFFDRLSNADIGMVVRQRLNELSQSSQTGVALAAGLLRHAVVMHMVHGMLPAGRSVTYVAAEGEEIPSLPDGAAPLTSSALTEASDAIAEEGQRDAGRGDVLVPFVPAARRFYLPQWVAFDDADKLIAKSVNEAEAHVHSMQNFIAVLHAAVGFAPYIVADSAYQQKRYGMLGQLVNQGRALARYQSRVIVTEIQRRAKANDLNRGLSLSLPYFDDQDLRMQTLNFEVIPGGRIMFVPSFVARAAQEQAAKVAQDTRLSRSTRKHLLIELQTLEQAFHAA